MKSDVLCESRRQPGHRTAKRRKRIFFMCRYLLDVYIQGDAKRPGASALDELVADRLEIEDVVTRSPEVAAPDVERIVLVLEPHGGVC